jgi:hypothetical protein
MGGVEEWAVDAAPGEGVAGLVLVSVFCGRAPLAHAVASLHTRIDEMPMTPAIWVGLFQHVLTCTSSLGVYAVPSGFVRAAV